MYKKSSTKFTHARTASENSEAVFVVLAGIEPASAA